MIRFIVLPMRYVISRTENLGRRRFSRVHGVLALFVFISSLDASAEIPATWELGQAVNADALSAIDIDVLPDGRGLPDGSGTASAGAELYAQQCAQCHGVAGEGGSAAALVSQEPPRPDLMAAGQKIPRAIGNYWAFATTVFDYIRRAMPWDKPGSLSNDEVYALTAWLLAENGLFDPAMPLTQENLADIVMPAQAFYRAAGEPVP